MIIKRSTGQLIYHEKKNGKDNQLLALSIHFGIKVSVRQGLVSSRVDYIYRNDSFH